MKNSGEKKMAQAQDVNPNPIGLNGVDFIEYAGSDLKHFETLFQNYGFQQISEIPGKKIKLFRQNDINFILNGQEGTFAVAFAKQHGPSICSTGFRVKDAEFAFNETVRRGAKPYMGSNTEKGATHFQLFTESEIL